jgi:hypothetical protein
MPTRPTPTRGRRVVAVAVAALLLGAASAGLDAVTAHAAAVGAQDVMGPPKRFPADIPGGYRRGALIPRGFVLLSRRVRMRPDEGWAPVRFTCPAGVRALAPGLNDPSELTFQIAGTQYRSARRRFVVDVHPAPAGFVHGRYASGRVYLVCGHRPLR